MKLPLLSPSEEKNIYGAQVIVDSFAAAGGVAVQVPDSRFACPIAATAQVLPSKAKQDCTSFWSLYNHRQLGIVVVLTTLAG